MTPEEFVHRLWSAHGAGDGWGEIWAKDHGSGKIYTKGWIKWPATIEEINSTLSEIPESYDRYVTPVIFRERKRDVQNAWPSRWVWLDVDHGYTGDYPPAVKVQTGHYTTQAYWLLPSAIPVPEAVAIGKRLHRRVGADIGSYTCKPLRIPGYLNGKEEYRDDPPLVKLLHFRSEYTELPLVDEPIDKIPQYPKNVLEQWSEPADSDRSVAAFKIYGALKRARFDVKQVKLVAELIPWIREKWTNPHHIHRDVERFFEKGVTRPKPAGDPHPRFDFHPMFGLWGFASSQGDKPYLVDGWIRAGSWHFLHGAPKTFKSAISHHLAAAVATGHSAFGRHRVNRKGPVLIIDWENSPQTYRETLVRLVNSWYPHNHRVIRVGNKRRLYSHDHVPVHVTNREIYLGQSDEELLERIKRMQPVLIIVDTLTSCAPQLDINDIVSWQTIQPTLEAMCDWGAALIVIHHDKKDVKDVSGFAKMAGSFKLGGWAEARISTVRRGDEVEVSFEGRFANPDPLILKVNPDHDQDEENTPPFNDFISESLTEAKEKQERERAEASQEFRGRIVNAIRQLGGSAPAFAIFTHLQKQGMKTSRRAINKLLDGLYDEGVLNLNSSKQYSISGEERYGNPG